MVLKWSYNCLFTKHNLYNQEINGSRTLYMHYQRGFILMYDLFIRKQLDLDRYV